jgi:hypothetical protein
MSTTNGVLLLILAPSLVLAGPATSVPEPGQRGAPAPRQPATATAPSKLGCFARGALQLVDVPGATGGAAGCSSRCSQLLHPLSAVGASGQCACSSVVPGASPLSRGGCPRDLPALAAVEVYYAHSGEISSSDRCRGTRPDWFALAERLSGSAFATTTSPGYARCPAPSTADDSASCRVSNLGQLGPSNIEVSYDSGGSLAFTPSDDGLSLRLDGTAGGRVHTGDGDHMYGLFQWDAAPSGAPGAVTGAYVSVLPTSTLVGAGSQGLRTEKSSGMRWGAEDRTR